MDAAAAAVQKTLSPGRRSGSCTGGAFRASLQFRCGLDVVARESWDGLERCRDYSCGSMWPWRAVSAPTANNVHWEVGRDHAQGTTSSYSWRLLTPVLSSPFLSTLLLWPRTRSQDGAPIALYMRTSTPPLRIQVSSTAIGSLWRLESLLRLSGSGPLGQRQRCEVHS
ncbi:hypothetical protein BD309DRAFT_451986 [Dichomitus squalens]|nr:hypothetical protein BD309DRAFT_451986 [Dichomitus squalens]